MWLNERALRDESFARSIFFSFHHRSRAHFDEHEWIFKTYKNKTLYMFDQAFYMWNLIYISKSSNERSSFIVIDDVEFMKNSRSWSFVRRQKKNSVARPFLFCDSALRPSGVKTVSRLAHIDLAYYASWGVRVVYSRSRKHLEIWKSECWDNYLI